jgi:putative transposase
MHCIDEIFTECPFYGSRRIREALRRQGADIVITRPTMVWASDITYIRLRQGFVYLVAIIDWFSRYVLSWRLSNSLEGYFCREALEEALTIGRPDIFNTDQGSQFTSNDFYRNIVE